jgi:hypothetical protein
VGGGDGGGGGSPGQHTRGAAEGLRLATNTRFHYEVTMLLY